MSSKIDSLKLIDKCKLNHHNFVVVKSIEELDNFAKNCNYKLSIRTDRKTGITKCLPFFLIDNQIEYYYNRSSFKLFMLCDYLLIASDGHFYDDYLKYNMVISIEKNDDFVAEYSSVNVPLRHMYKYPNKLAIISGNVNERYFDWYLYNTRVSGLDIRLIRDKIYEQYLVVLKNNLFNRYLELSVYSKDCGVNNSDTVYWEV